MSKGVEDWNPEHDHGVPPTPWSVRCGGVYDALGRRILISNITSTTRGYVGVNDEMLDAVVRLMNERHKSGNGGVASADEKSMSTLQAEIVSWADATFPDRQPHQGFMKLYEELGEVIRDPQNAHEWADVFIMLFDLMDRYGVYGHRLSTAIYEKMKINRQRRWVKNAMGVMQHADAPDDQTIDMPVNVVDGPHAGVASVKMDVSYAVVPIPPDEISMTIEGGTTFVYSLCYGESNTSTNKYSYKLYRVTE